MQRRPLNDPALLSGLGSLVQAEREAKLEDARAQVAWDGEVAAHLLSNLRSFFTNQLSSSNFVLHPVREGQAVESLLLPQLPSEVQVGCAIEGGPLLAIEQQQQRLAHYDSSHTPALTAGHPDGVAGCCCRGQQHRWQQSQQLAAWQWCTWTSQARVSAACTLRSSCSCSANS